MTSVPVLFLALLSPWKIKNASVTNKIPVFINSVVYHLISVFYHHLCVLHFFTIFCNGLMGKKEHKLLFYFLTWYWNLFYLVFKISVRPIEYIDLLNRFFYPLQLLFWFKGPDPTVRAEESLWLSLPKVDPRWVWIEILSLT